MDLELPAVASKNPQDFAKRSTQIKVRLNRPLQSVKGEQDPEKVAVVKERKRVLDNDKEPKKVAVVNEQKRVLDKYQEPKNVQGLDIKKETTSTKNKYVTYDQKLEATKNKLHEGYAKIQEEKRKRRIQFLEEVPKSKFTCNVSRTRKMISHSVNSSAKLKMNKIAL